MKKSNVILSVTLLLTLFCFCSCNKALKERDMQTIEEFKNSPHDPRLIGKWKLLDMDLEKVKIAFHFHSDAVLERGLPVYDKNNEIAYYKRDREEIYFHTINDSHIRHYIISNNLLYGSYFMSDDYKVIHEDTIHIYNANSESIGIRDNNINIKD